MILVDTLVNLLSVISGPAEKNPDPEAVANLINLIAQANAPPSELHPIYNPHLQHHPLPPWTPRDLALRKTHLHYQHTLISTRHYLDIVSMPSHQPRGGRGFLLSASL